MFGSNGGHEKVVDLFTDLSPPLETLDVLQFRAAEGASVGQKAIRVLPGWGRLDMTADKLASNKTAKMPIHGQK